MQNNLAQYYLFPEALLRLSMGDYSDSAAASLFIAGVAAGLLMFSSLGLLLLLGLNRRKPDVSSAEHRYRAGAAGAVLCAALGLGLPFIPGFGGPSMLAASLMELAGLLGFTISLALLLLIRLFPKWSFKQLLPLPLLALGVLLLPLFGQLKAPFALGCFSLALGLLCLAFLGYTIKYRRPWAAFLWNSLLYLVLGFSFVLPLPGTFIWPALCLAYLLLEHRLFSRISVLSSLSLLPADVAVPETRTGPEPVQAASGRAASPGAEAVEAKAVEVEAEAEAVEAEEVEAVEAEAVETEAVDIKAGGGAAPAKLPAAPSVSSFIPREFLAILNKKTVADLKLGDHIKQEMTIFFSDIRQFTDLSENLTPEESFAFINSYLSRIVPEITKNGGFVDKYIGDAILALFPQAQGPDMAVRSAIAIQGKVREYNSHRANCGYRPLSMGIGLHTGTLMVGVVGTKDRMQSTVISDAVNLASRVESLTKAFRVSLAISEETFKKLEDPGSYQYRFVGKVRVKGKAEPVSIFEIFDGVDEKIQKKKIEANRFFEQGMFLYYQKKYTDALQEFRRVLEILPDDGAAGFYIENCLTKIKV
ncbi:MAG: adenylate/guanylate cyclase domain-containing protein [Spirochaetaceae bacterium]|jgi:two-component system sensor histidine kinase ChiS|nr:adenylate/guanylate cyclase domain-containing protein [Spirochaetaceae bacterium]